MAAVTVRMTSSTATSTHACHHATVPADANSTSPTRAASAISRTTMMAIAARLLLWPLRSREPLAHETQRDTERDVQRRHQHGEHHRQRGPRSRHAPEVEREGCNRGNAAEDEAVPAGD